MSLSTINPEIVRNARIHLRPGRMVVIVVICAVISISAAAYYLSAPMGIPASPRDWRDLLTFVIYLQIAALLIGGGIYCLLSIHREKDLNTFDFQRVTRLTPFELVIGKLFGAPIQMYFSFLCLMPVALWAAIRGVVPVSIVVMIYVLIILGSIAFHALALLLSLIMERGTSAGGIVLFLIIVGVTSVDFSGTGSGPFGIRALSPFFAANLTPEWSAESPASLAVRSMLRETQDTLFGFQIEHFWVLVVLYLTLTAWFLLADVRNIKRDPVAYELYSPAQGFLFCVYANLLLLSFLRWTTERQHFTPPRSFSTTIEPVAAGTTEVLFLMISLFLFALFALTLLRNRDLVRRRAGEFGARAAGWWAALWPAPYLLLGSLLAGAGIVWAIQFKLHPVTGWDVRFGALEVLFFAAWIARDALYLQWMNLRRVRRPVLVAVLYMVVFYASVSTLFIPLHWYEASRAPYASILVPANAFRIDPSEMPRPSRPWALALAVICTEAAAFAVLQRRTLKEILAMSPR